MSLIRLLLAIAAFVLVESCSSSHPLENRNYSISDLEDDFHIQRLYDMPYSVDSSEERLRIFIMVDSCAHQYNIMIVDQISGGWHSDRIYTIDSVSQSEESQNVWYEYYSGKEQREYSEYSFRLLKDWIVDYDEGKKLGLCYNFEGYNYVFTLENKPDSVYSDVIFDAWKVEGLDFINVQCKTLTRQQYTLGCEDDK